MNTQSNVIVNNVDIDKIFLVDVSLFGKTYTVRIKVDNKKSQGVIVDG